MPNEYCTATTPTEGQVLTVRIARAVKMLGIGRSKLYECIGAEEIETIKIGRSTLIPVDSLHQFVARRRSKP